MSLIQIKGINDYLLFILNDEVDEDELLYQLKIMTSSPSFKKKHFYPKGYFDFGTREVSYMLFLKLMQTLCETQSVIFCGFKSPKSTFKSLLTIQMNIRNGDIIEQKEDCIFDGKINPGGKLIVFGNLYMLGTCYGEIELIGTGVECSISKMKDATLIINGIRLDSVNIDKMTVFYELNGQILNR